MSYKSYRIAFGIHKGKMLKHIPQKYLKYISDKDYCPKEVKSYLDELVTIQITNQDKKIRKHPYYKGYFSDGAIKHRKKRGLSG